MIPRILTLHVKKEYFDQIKSGEKTEEYRRTIQYWRTRIYCKDFDQVEIVLGYPKAGDVSKRLRFPWKGYEIKTITHPIFGNVPMEVYAVKLERDDQ